MIKFGRCDYQSELVYTTLHGFSHTFVIMNLISGEDNEDARPPQHREAFPSDWNGENTLSGDGVRVGWWGTWTVNYFDDSKVNLTLLLHNDGQRLYPLLAWYSKSK